MIKGNRGVCPPGEGILSCGPRMRALRLIAEIFIVCFCVFVLFFYRSPPQSCLDSGVVSDFNCGGF